MATPTPPAKGKASAPTEPSPNDAPQGPAPKGPQGQQATAQQKGPGPATPGPQSPSSKPAPGPNPGLQKPQGQNGPPQKSGPNTGPPGPPPIQMGPSPDLQEAYAFLQNYVQTRGLGANGLPADMLNGGEPDSGSPLNNLGQALPSTVTGDIKSFPKYSLATGAPNSPGLPTGLMPPSRPAFNPQQQVTQQLVGGLPRDQVKINQRKLNNA